MHTAIPKLADLVADPCKAATLPQEAIPGLLGELEKLKAALWARLTAPQNGCGPVEPEKDNLLKAEQAAPILGVTPRWLYRHSRQLPFARHLSRKVLRFSESGLRKWQATKKA